MGGKRQKFYLEYMLSGIVTIAVMVKTMTVIADCNPIQFGEIKVKSDFSGSRRSARFKESSNIMFSTLPTPQIKSSGNEVKT